MQVTWGTVRQDPLLNESLFKGAALTMLSVPIGTMKGSMHNASYMGRNMEVTGAYV